MYNYVYMDTQTLQSISQYKSSNMLKTFLLMGIAGAIIISIGYYLSLRFQSVSILFISVGISTVISFVSYWFSDTLAIKSCDALLADERTYSELHSIVADIAMRAQLVKPRVYIIPDHAPNAFATGRDEQHSAIAVSVGLLEQLNQDEIAGVVAHEMSHIMNRDILLMSVTSVVCGLIALLIRMLASNDDQHRSLMMSLALGIASQIAAVLIQMAVSRRREYLADESAAIIMQNAKPLASALGKIHAYAEPMSSANSATAHMYISNPFGSLSQQLFSSHPSTESRVQRLHAMKF